MSNNLARILVATVSLFYENDISFSVIIKITGSIGGHFTTVLQVVSESPLNRVSINIKSYLLPMIIDAYMWYYKFIQTVSIKIDDGRSRFVFLHVRQLKTCSKTIIRSVNKSDISGRIQ